MNITKVKTRESGLELRWKDQDDTTRKETTFTCSDEPAESFTDALHALLAPCLSLIEAQDWEDEAEVMGLSVTYESERRGFVVTIRKELEATRGPLIVNTPYIVDDADDDTTPVAPRPMTAAVDRVIHEAGRYLNGHRAQRDLVAEMQAAE